MGNTVKIDASAVGAFLRDSDGPVARQFLVVGEQIKMRTISKLKQGFPRDFLAPSIVKRITMESNGPHLLVGTDHVKTRPHPIEGNPLLVFRWKKMGNQLMFLRHVNHPGSDFTAYMTRVLLEAIAETKGKI